MSYRKITNPYWIAARHAGRCYACQTPIARGDLALWAPARKRLYCQPCGDTYDRQTRREVAYERYGTDCALDC